MAEPDHFSWLHLTDFHYGLNGQDCLWPTLRPHFLDDLEKLHDCCGPWQTVLFTGDLVQSGALDQFEEMQREVLDRIWNKLTTLGSGDSVLLAVPGNHDLQRPEKKSDNPARDTLLRKGGFSDAADRFWNDPDSGYRRVVNDAFASYSSWHKGAKQGPKSGVTAGLLPGDFSYTFEHGSRRIGLIGLNTTFLQLDGGDYRERLVWDARQIHCVSGGAIDDWLNKHDLSLLLTHQGPDWLTSESREHGDSEVAPAGRFALHLFGHMHETSIVYVSRGGGSPVRRCQSRSVFGMEKFGDPPSEQRSHGYVAGRIEFQGQKATLRLWPRLATKGTGPWRFVPDQEKAELRDDGGTNPEEISLRPVARGAPLTAEKVARSDFIKIPTSTWPEELAGKGFPMPDSMLLLPESRVVRFHRSRERLRDTIIEWAIEKGPPVKLRLQAGEGGAGKTRLLIEVCDHLEKSHGWRAGFLDRSQSISSGLPVLLKEGKPVLIVLDYAETRTQEIVELASTTLHASVTPQVCLVLLARDGGDWWDHLADSAKGDQAVAAILRGLSSKTGPYRMNAEFIGQKDRPNAFAEALHDFAAFKGREPPIDPDIDLSENLFGDPLFIHLAALAYLRGQPSINDQELLGAALGHERSYWRRLLEEGHLTDLLPAFEQAVALFTLCGDRRTTKDAKALLGRTPRLQGADGRSLTQIFDILRRLYSIDGGLTGLQPDLLGETLVSEALSKDDELLDAAFGEDSDGETIRYALTVLTRLGRRVPAQQRWLKEALSRNLTRVSEAAMQVGLETGSPLPELYAEVIKDAPTGDRRRAVDTLRTKLPGTTVNLASLAVEVRRQFVIFLDQKKSGGSAKRHINAFDALSLLASALRSNGLLSEAADASLEAAHHAQAVFRSADARDRQRLAAAFGNLGAHLGDVGRFEEGLKAAEKAEALRRVLAEKQPDAYTADWARSLSNLADSRLATGDFPGAVHAAEAAISRIADYARSYPANFDPWLGFARRVIADSLLKMDRPDDALAEASRSVEIWTKVTATRRSFESKQVAKAFLSVMRCQFALKQTNEAINTFERVLDILEVTLSVNPKPLQSTLVEMLALVQSVDRDAADRIASGRLQRVLSG